MDLESWALGPANQEQTCGERLAELITINRGEVTVTQVGVIVKTDKNRYGRLGLQVGEALELAHLSGCVLMLSQLFPNQVDDFRELIRRKSAGRNVEIATPETVRRLVG